MHTVTTASTAALRISPRHQKPTTPLQPEPGTSSMKTRTSPRRKLDLSVAAVEQEDLEAFILQSPTSALRPVPKLLNQTRSSETPDINKCRICKITHSSNADVEVGSLWVQCSSKGCSCCNIRYKSVQRILFKSRPIFISSSQNT